MHPKGLTPRTAARREPSGRGAAAVGLLGLLGVLSIGGCRQEFLAATIERGADSTSEASSGSTDPSSTTSTGESSTDASSTTAGGAETFVETTGPLPDCEAPKGHSVCDSDEDPMHAIGLGCGSGPFDSTEVDGVVVSSPDPAALRLCRQYGSSDAFIPTEGGKMLILSTGVLPEPDGAGTLTIPMGQTGVPGGGNANPDADGLPAPIQPIPAGSGAPFQDCDGSGDCSNTLPDAWDGGPARDLVWFAFEVPVPPGTFGYRVDLAWFSAEFPEDVGAPGDVFVWWQSSEAFTGNLAYLDGQALTPTGAASAVVDSGLVGNAPGLLGTGFEGTQPSSCRFDGGTYANCPNGGSTGWLELDGPVVPGEVVQTTVALFDVDSLDIDTTVVIDNWRWNCGGCDAATTCGIHPRQ